MTDSSQPQDSCGNQPTDRAGRPWLLCTVVTFVAIPVWFVGLHVVWNAAKPIDCPAGVLLYMVLCLVASVVVVPLNAFAIAPILAKLSFRSDMRSILVHLLTGIAIYIALWYWPFIISRMPSLVWTVIPYYLSVFLLPPMLLGSLAYSIRYNVLNGQTWTNNPMNQSE
jgi:ABC-type anion transport system duplicated permease subunit